MRAEGWRIELFYLALPSIEMSLLRVGERVAHGGHHIPSVIINSVPPSSEALAILKALQEAVSKNLDKKRRLSQYAVIWQDGRRSWWVTMRRSLLCDRRSIKHSRITYAGDCDACRTGPQLLGAGHGM